MMIMQVKKSFEYCATKNFRFTEFWVFENAGKTWWSAAIIAYQSFVKIAKMAL